MARIDEEVAVGVKEEGSQALSFDRTKREEENAGSTSLTMAKMLQGKIKRKHVKQPVMTTTYGVTAIGAAEQVLKQLEALDTLGPVDGKTRRRAAFYIGKKVRRDCALQRSPS